MSVFLTVEDVRNVCYEYARSRLAYSEPIPSFETRYPDRLEGALGAPQRSFDGDYLCPSLPEQAAVLFYELIKQHPFLNGNKRIACVSLMTFLLLNKKWVRVDWKELYDVAKIVAASPAENRDGVLKLLSDFVGSNSFDS